MKYTILMAGLLLAIGNQMIAQAQTERLYVGTYSTRGSKGIYVLNLDRATGTLTEVGSVDNKENPSFLALHPSKKFLYAVNENNRGMSGASAYGVDPGKATLTLLNQQATGGANPCHINLSQSARLAFVSAYGGGTFAALPVGADGRLGTAIETIRYIGKNPDNPRQDAPHVHSATLSTDGRQVYVADLGNDRVYTYDIDKQTIKPNEVPFVTVKSGSGPRHMVMHPNGRFAYLVEELTSSVAVFSRNPKTGSLTLLRDGIATLPPDFTGKNTSADIHIDASGTYLYQSNRGHNALAIMRIGKDGVPVVIGHSPTGGKTPRNFWLDPNGQFVVVANQDSDNLVVFRRDARTGLLTPTGRELAIPAPVCVISR